MTTARPTFSVPAASQANREDIYALSRDLLCTLTPTGVVLCASASAERILGYAPGSLPGQPLLTLVHPLDRPLVERAFTRVLERGYADDVPTRFRACTGGHVSLRWTGVRDASGERVQVIAREMKHERERTARRRARAALKAAAAERVRLRADLHDGTLQTLAGASLKLTSAMRLLDTDRAAAQQLLESVAQLLQQEQRELRFLVEEMKQGWLEARRASAPSLTERLTDFARRLHATWDIELLSFVTGDGTVPEPLLRPVFGIVHEAVVNAVRHGKATAATVHVDLGPDAVRLRISDNGRGLSFNGQLDDQALRVGDQGPAVLKHRVWSLGGTINVASHPQGVLVAIRIPYEEPS